MLKLCKDCAHHRDNFSLMSQEAQIKNGFCAKSEITNPVDGTVTYEPSHMMRSFDSRCGMVAKWWEKK